MYMLLFNAILFSKSVLLYYPLSSFGPSLLAAYKIYLRILIYASNNVFLKVLFPHELSGMALYI